ncbi:MAG: ATP-binding cassette domain-containing protein [Desulfobacterales bacterium]|nr:ATP-binding cassette domain-containing protein [Desulfobacterales bacterium]MDX2510913.1 ATP-binding cassette domain-containing protein [Desulfobacterales bacterium]
MSPQPILDVQDIVKYFPLAGGLWSKRKAWIKAVDGVSFQIHKGESFGLVGESGCGKTTLGRIILRLLEPNSGSIRLNGVEITHLNRREMRSFRRDVQMIFQDPQASLDPRMTVASIVTEPLRAFQKVDRQQLRSKALNLLKKVGLKAEDLDKYPHAFSGGERQRIGIARALCLNPGLIVADEPVSALDMSIQAQVLNLLGDLKASFDFSSLISSHDLSVVNHMCDRIAVMYLGVIVEMAPATLFGRVQRHPYTAALVSAIPIPDPHQKQPPLTLEGEIPSPVDPPSGCLFHTRCPYCFDRCRVERPTLIETTPEHNVACWLSDGRGLEPEVSRH